MSQNSSLQIIMGEIKNLTPDITNAFVLKKDGAIIANSENATADQTQGLSACLNKIKANSIGGIETFTILDSASHLSINKVDDYYLATVSSRMGNQKIVSSITQVVIPTIIRLAFNAAPKLTDKEDALLTSKLSENAVLPAKEKAGTETKTDPSVIVTRFLPKAPTMQFMVEKISGLLVTQDTVRIDPEVIIKWENLYGEKQFTHVIVETLDGKTITCKFKPKKEGKSNIKGVIQVPEKILQSLQCDKGKLVIIKPFITEEI